jgi:hypothetical protein
MVKLLLEEGEELVISSYAQFCESDSSNKPKTGDAFLTDRRFVFIGRMQIKTLGQLIKVAKGEGETRLEIPVCTVIQIEKEETGDSIKMVYKKESGEKNALIKPERIRYFGALLDMGVSMVSKEIGKMITESISEKVGEEIGDRVGGYLGGGIDRFAQGTMEEFLKGLVDAWVEAFRYSMKQRLPGGVGVGGPQDFPVLKRYHSEESFAEPGVLRKPEDLPVLKKNREMKAVLLEQIFEEELGRDFRDVEIPLNQLDYIRSALTNRA